MTLTLLTYLLNKSCDWMTSPYFVCNCNINFTKDGKGACIGMFARLHCCSV